MKFIKTLLIGSVTALALCNNVNAKETLFETKDIEQVIANNIEFVINDLNKLTIESDVKRQLDAMNFEQSTQQLLVLVKFDETKQKPSASE